MKKFTTILLTLSIIASSGSGVFAQEAPVAPTPPAAPTAAPAPTAPPPPQAAPTSQPTPTPVASTPTPTLAPTPVFTPTPTGTSGATTTQTGDTTTGAAVINQANTNETSLSGTDSPPNSSHITENGSGSQNTSDHTSDSSIHTAQTNTAGVDTGMDVQGTTGNNASSGNVGDTLVKTGNSNVFGTSTSYLNTNMDNLSVSHFTVADNQTGDLVIDMAGNCISGCQNLIGGNGSQSLNTSHIKSEAEKNLIQSNTADVGNNLNLSADSGNNTASLNTGGDTTIKSGDANVSAAALTFANNNLSGNVALNVIDVYGNLNGDIVLPQDAFSQFANNGSDSTTASSISTDSQTENTQTNNAVVTNEINTTANTGNNSVGGNTGGDSVVKTGTANVVAQTLNIVNSNIVGGNWWLVLVNQAGKWVGKIVGVPDGQNVAASQGTDITVASDGTISADIGGNGSGSDNSSSITTSTSTAVNQSNSATVGNSLNLSANTGNNSASYNTNGDTLIETGDANIVANIINFVNNNLLTGGNLIVTVVNVFGEWSGNFLAPGYTKAVQAAPNSSLPTSSSSSDMTTTPASTSHAESASPSPVGQVLAAVTAPIRRSRIPSAVRPTTGSPTTSISEYAYADASQSVSENEVLSSSENSSKSITVNLAWLLLGLPVFGVGVFAKGKILLGIEVLRRLYLST